MLAATFPIISHTVALRRPIALRIPICDCCISHLAPHMRRFTVRPAARS